MRSAPSRRTGSPLKTASLLLVMLLIGFTMVTGLDASNTLVQRIVPDELRGRVMAIWSAGTALTLQAAKEHGLSVLIFAIWAVYIRLSSRVRATFTH